MTRARRNAAFTLFEVLVTLSLVAIVLGIAYGSYAASVKSVSRCRARASLAGDARAVLRQMAREIRCAWMPARDGPKRPIAAFVGESSALTFATAAGGWGLDAPSAGISVVGYRCDRGTLFRSQCSVADAAGQLDAWQPMVGGARKLEMEFFDGTSWQREWNSEDCMALPAAVRIGITLAGRDSESAALATAAWIGVGKQPAAARMPASEVGANDAQLAQE